MGRATYRWQEGLQGVPTSLDQKASQKLATGWNQKRQVDSGNLEGGVIMEQKYRWQEGF